MRPLLFFILFTFWISPQSYAQVGDSLLLPVVWLRADQGTITPSRWPDRSGNGRDATATAGEGPVLRGTINYNPAMTFDGVNDQMKIPYSLEGLSGVSSLAVFAPADTNERGIWTTVAPLAQPAWLSTQRVLGPDSVIDTYGTYAPNAVLSSVVQRWNLPPLVGDSASLSLGNGGPKATTPTFKGMLAEWMLFDHALEFLERLQAETYLAIKYGITLLTGNYVSSAEQVLWNAQDNAAFANRIAGIGRDDLYQLNQKQSRSAQDTSGLLIMSAGTLASTNAGNPTRLNNGDFLVWGDNNGSLTTQEGTGADSVLRRLGRQWLMTVSGTTAPGIATELRVNQGRFPVSPTGYWLIVDRSGTGNFSLDSLEYHSPDSLNNAGTAVFKNITWDTDRSGSDQFSLVQTPALLALIRKTQNPTCSDLSAGQVSLQILGGKAPYHYRLENGNDGLVREGTGTVRVEQTQLTAGLYTLTVSDAAHHQVSRRFSLSLPNPLPVNLGRDTTLAPQQMLTLDASAHIPDSVAATYQWESNNGFSSSDPRVTITESGIYQVRVTNAQGCVFSDTLTVAGSAAALFNVFPTLLSSDEHFTVNIALARTGPVHLRVFDPQGRLQQQMQGDGRSQYTFQGAIGGSGLYLVVLQTSSGIETKKLIVH